MADLFVFEHPLALFGPTGIDDNGEEWLNGERPRDLQADQWADAGTRSKEAQRSKDRH